MKYLGIDTCGGTAAIGVFDGSTRTIEMQKHDFGGKILGLIYHRIYKKNQSKPLFYLVRSYARFMIRRLLKSVDDISIDYVVVASQSGSRAILSALSFIEKKYQGKVIVRSDHNWGYLNAIKYHPDFKYPALVVDASLHHCIVAYISSDKGIRILDRTSPASSEFECGLGYLTVNLWVKSLQEDVFWPSQETKGKKSVYELYNERGHRGNVVVDMKEEIKGSKDIFCQEVFEDSFPKKMETIRPSYPSLERYKDDWVASQWQVLRDVLSSIKEKYHESLPIGSFFVSGGISLNPALQKADWLKVPKDLAGAQGAGCAMAYLGYCINEQGLEVNHEEWKDYLFP